MRLKTRSTAALVILIGFHHFAAMRAATITAQPVGIEIKTISEKGQLLSHVLKMVNDTDSDFNGVIAVNTAAGMRALSQGEQAVHIAPGDSGFVAFRLLLAKDLAAGEKQIRYDLFNDAGECVAHCETSLQIEQRERLTLLADNAPLLITNTDDSVRVRVTVRNSGNMIEQITLVFNVPNLQYAPPFTEVTASLAPGEQQEFIHRFIASSNLLAAEQFQVRTTAMKGSEKKIVGTKSVTIHSISAHRSYNALQRDQMAGYDEGATDNAIQLSYRTYNNTSSTIQLQGGSYFDLPAGYLHLKGNIYKYNTRTLPYVTNTSLTYRLYGNEFTLGNVSEQAELSLYGRGAKASFSDSLGSRRFTIGAIDQNYNLLATDPWFNDYYSFFIKGELGARTGRTGTTVDYVFQRNPYERARFHMTSVAWRYRFSDQWDLELKSHGSMAQYQETGSHKLTGAAELRYGGTLFSDLMLNGSAYYSDPYYSGNRKGALSLTQGVSKRLSDDIYLSGSFSYHKSEPKSLVYDYNYRSQNSYANVSVSLPRLAGTSSSLQYNYQSESSPSYSRYLGEGETDRNLTMAAHRLGWQWRWQSPSSIHSLFGNLEGGFYRNPFDENRERQGKASLSYAYRWLTTGITWQQGAYYLYEQVMAQQLNRAFTRFTASTSINHRLSKSFHLSSGFNFSRDVYQGNVPSVNINARYFTRHHLSFSLSGYWYKYPLMQNRDMLNLEVGVRYQFRRGEPLRGKKSSLIAKIYYDYNGNSRYDKGDIPAAGYLLSIDQKIFKSGSNGVVHYTSIPFGTYTMKPMQTGQWSFDQQTFKVNRFSTQIEIPLRQSGTLKGKIRYSEGENSVDVIQRYEGLRFYITGTDDGVRQTVVTGSDGHFLTFLPVGEYSILLDVKTLVEHTYCAEPLRMIKIEAGKITELEPFEIQIQSRKVNVKKFFAEQGLTDRER